MKNNFILFSILFLIQSCQVKLGDEVFIDNNILKQTSEKDINLNTNDKKEQNNLSLGTLNFRTILRGVRSNVKKYDFQVIKDELSLNKVWDEHTGNQTNPLYLPKIDFKQKQIIVIFLGERPTTGYGVEINKIEEKADRFKISIKEIQPNKGSIIKAEITQPFIIIETIKTNKTVVFENLSPISSNFIELDHNILESGSNSGINKFSTLFAKNQEDFTELYQKHLSNQKFISSPIFPKINFDEKMVASIFLGERPSSGFTINIDKVIKSNSLITIFAKEVPPKDESKSLATVSTPFTFLTFPNTNLPIKFDINLVFQNQLDKNNTIENKIKNLEVEPLLNGNNSSIINSDFSLINSNEQFKKIWTKHVNDSSSLPPDINFNEKSLFALFLGNKNSSIIKLDIDKVIKNGDDLRVFIKISNKENSSELTSVFRPYKFATIPKHNGSVSFIVNDLSN